MNILTRTDLVLRGPDESAAGRPTALLLCGHTVVCGALYGAAMGTFGGFASDRLWQMLYSGLKVPLLLLVTFALSLPSFFVLNTLFGLRDDFAEVVAALFRGQAGLTIVLAALAPYTLLWYASFTGYDQAILFNGAVFATASFAAQLLLRRWYAPLIARSPRHRRMMRLWLVLYSFVAIQMAWVLRPFVGQPGVPVQFFRDEAWGNAYVIVARTIWDVLAR